MLRNREITLLNLASWDDRNDRETMAHYSRSRQLKTLLAACFSQSIETYHHWRVFAHGPSGVCVVFFKDALLQAVPSEGFTHNLVTYQSATELQSSYPLIRDLPFLKGKPYRDEIEYRVIYASEEETITSKSFPIELSVVRAVTLSPWLAPALFEATKAAIHEIPGCSGLPITQSPVVESQLWLQHLPS